VVGSAARGLPANIAGTQILSTLPSVGIDAMDADETHPSGCMCEPCKTHRHNDMMQDCHPEEHRQQRIIKGRDSTPSDPERRIPEGMSERDARAAGHI